MKPEPKVEEPPVKIPVKQDTGSSNDPVPPSKEIPVKKDPKTKGKAQGLRNSTAAKFREKEGFAEIERIRAEEADAEREEREKAQPKAKAQGKAQGLRNSTAAKFR